MFFKSIHPFSIVNSVILIATCKQKMFRSLKKSISSLFPNVQKIVPNLTPDQVSDLKTRIEADLKVGADGLLYQTARANAIMGAVT